MHISHSEKHLQKHFFSKTGMRVKL